MKTHYRKVFKSDHLGTPDLEDLLEQGKPLEFTIREVKQEYNTSVAGRKIDANIAYFKENIKPLVLNATNSKTVKNLCGGSSFVEDWKNVLVELYIDTTVRMKGEVVGGVRIKNTPPTPLTEKNIKVIKAKAATILDAPSLNKYYATLSPKEKTNKQVMTILKERQTEIKEK